MDEISVKLNEVPTLNASLEHIVVNNAEAIRSHTLLNDRDRADQHPISAITGLEEALNSAISEQKINEAVNSALATAKESGEFDGKDGKNGKSAYAYAQDGGFTGTEAQLSAKLAIPVVTPQMYGGTDDVAIQAAINAADYVLLPEGNYTINNPVIITSEKKIQIEGTVTVTKTTQGTPRIEINAIISYEVPIHIVYDAAGNGLDNIQVDAANIRKQIINGQLYIIRGGKAYNAIGTQVK